MNKFKFYSTIYFFHISLCSISLAGSFDKPIHGGYPGIVLLSHDEIQTSTLPPELDCADNSSSPHRSSKNPWEMTRIQWREAGSPDLNIKWVEGARIQPEALKRDEQLEREAINKYIELFEDPILAVKMGIIGRLDKAYPAASPEKLSQVTLLGLVESDRQADFALKRSEIQSTTALPEAKWDNLEDAREAIIIGRKLGYFEHDILKYIVRNYLPAEVINSIDSDKEIPNHILKLYPSLTKISSNQSSSIVTKY